MKLQEWLFLLCSNHWTSRGCNSSLTSVQIGYEFCCSCYRGKINSLRSVEVLLVCGGISSFIVSRC